MGYVGLIGNIHFTEILDFIVGWVGFDLSKDDWATRIANRERAPEGTEGVQPDAPAKEAPETRPEEPPKPKPTPTPSKPSPPREPKKDTRSPAPKRDLRDLIP
ncbi:MAG TPA: hypothetical protein PLE19_05875 [Planctomycetota bacterium]|nr:hypothetical protein [Planctomycetota bacterium]HRR80250.1 hypothetical protein [Planctomycetota bacterium]HRT95618.1 hypothetical protein [Planctomycetota bacterium]